MNFSRKTCSMWLVIGMHQNLQEYKFEAFLEDSVVFLWFTERYGILKLYWSAWGLGWSRNLLLLIPKVLFSWLAHHTCVFFIIFSPIFDAVAYYRQMFCISYRALLKILCEGVGAWLWKLSVIWGFIQGWNFKYNLHWSISGCCGKNAETIAFKGI